MMRVGSVVFSVFLLSCGAWAADVGLIKIDGVIGPATAGYIARALEISGARQDACLIIQLDTPGGLLESTKDIVQQLYASKVPTVVYVAPSGASAGSAGCFITLAADVAAMAPHTTIGAAHPVSMGPTGGTEKPDEVMTKKLENFSVSFMESIAQRRGRNIDWAKSSVRESASITAEAALELKVIDLIASDVPDLLTKLDGREVSGHRVRTAGAGLAQIPMAAREKLFQLLWRPEVLLVLMLAAIYGIIGELNNPGAVLPGVVGAIALILALYMAAILPVNAAGVALIVVAVILFVIDIYASTHGVLTFGGIIAFFLGALMLFDHNEPLFRLSLTSISVATLLTAGFFVFIAGAGLRAQFLPARTGREAMVGRTVAALSPVDASQGKVMFEGEYWNATSEIPIAEGAGAEIVGVDGLTLKVKPKLS